MTHAATTYKNLRNQIYLNKNHDQKTLCFVRHVMQIILQIIFATDNDKIFTLLWICSKNVLLLNT